MLTERRCRTDDAAEVFESEPSQSYADAGCNVIADVSSAKSTADWLMQMELLAQEHRLPDEDSAQAASSDQSRQHKQQQEEFAAARAGLGDGLAESYSVRADRVSLGQARGPGGDDERRREERVREAAMLLAVAEGHLDEEDAAEAIQTAAAAHHLFAELGDWASAGDALRVALGGHRLQGSVEAALVLLEGSLRRVRESNQERGGEATMLLATAEGHMLLGNASDGHSPCEGAGHDEALQLARQALRVATAADEVRLQAASWLLQSRLHLLGDRHGEGLLAAQEALHLSLSPSCNGEHKLEARARHQLAEAHLAVRHFSDARQHAKEARRLFRELGSKRSEASELLLLCDAHLALDSPGEAQHCAEEALDLFVVLGFCKGQELALRRNVDALLAAQDPNGAIAFARRILAICRDSGDGHGEVSALFALAAAQLGAMAPAEALRTAEEALAVCRHLGDRRRHTAALHTLAEMQVLNGHLAAAVSGFQEALRLCRELSDARGQASALLALAGLHADQDPRAALAEAKQARNLLERAGERKKVATALSLISGLHRSLGEFEKADAAAGLAREICQAAGDRAGEASGLLAVARARLACGEGVAAALRAAREAQALLKDPGGKQERQVLEKTLHWMAHVHFQTAQPEEALKVAKKGESLVRKHRASTDHDKARMKLLSAQAKLELLWQLAADEATAESRHLRREFEAALRTAELATRLARPAGDAQLLASALHTLGHTFWFGSRYAEALHAATEAAELLRGAGDAQLQIRNLALLAQGQEAAGDVVAAQGSLEQALGLARGLGDEAYVEELSTLQAQLLSAPAAAAADAPPAAAVAEVHAEAAAAAAAAALAADSVAAAVALRPALDDEAVRRAIFSLVQDSSRSDVAPEDETPLMEAGLDSLSSVELRNRLQNEFGLTLGSAVIFNYPTEAALTRLIVEEGTAKGIAWGRA